MGNQQSQMTGEEEAGSPSKRLPSLSPEIDDAQNPIFSSQVPLLTNGRLNPHHTSNLALEKNINRPSSPLSGSQAHSQINEHDDDDDDGLPLHIPNFGSPEKISTMVSGPKEKAKRRRSKKHSASKSDQDASPQADTHSSLDLGTPTENTQDQVNGLSPGSPDNNNDESGIAAEESESGQRRARKERKEQKRAQKAERERLRAEQIKAEPEDNMQMNGSMHVRDSDELPEPTPTLKRKAKDSSSKKQRKKRKQQSGDESVTADNTAARPGPEDNAPPDTIVPNGHVPAASISGLQDQPSFGHFAQNVYSSRYGSQHDTPNGPDDSRLDVDNEDAEQSPSAARLGRRSRSRANSVASQSSTGEAVRTQHEPVTQDEDDVEPSQYMDVDEQSDNDTEAAYAGLVTEEWSRTQPLTKHASADEDMSDVAQDDLPMINHDAQNSEIHMGGAELGSDDLGAAAAADVMFSDADTDVDLSARATKNVAAPETQTSEPNTVDTRIIRESPAKSAKSSRKSGLLQQYGSKPSTGRKRVAKKPFINGSQVDNVESLASLPGGLSPAAGAAKRRKARAGGDSEQDVAEPSSVETNSPAEGKEKAKKKAETSSATQGKATLAPNSRGSFVSKPRMVPDPPRDTETKGPFSQYEMDKLKTVLEHWKQDNNMDQHDLNEMMHKNPQVVKSYDFWDAVHAVVPTRRRQKVINQCRRIWHNFVALSTWTPEQHRELVVLYETHGNNYKVIGQMINRHPEDVRERIRNYVIPGDNRKTEAWAKAEEDKLLAIIEAAVKEIQSQKAKGELEQDIADDQHIDWLEVSEQMGRTRSRLQCLYKWKKLQLKMAGGVIDGQAGRSMEDIIAEARQEAATMPALHLYYVVKAIKDAGTTSESRIPWARLGDKSQRTGRYPRATSIVVWVRLRRTIPNDVIFTVNDIATKLCDRHRHTEELRWPSDDEVELEEEYQIVEKKILKILQATGRPRTAYYNDKSENKAVDEDSDGDNETGTVANAASQAPTDVAPRHSSIDLSFDRPKPTIPSDREIEESDYSPPKQLTVGKKAAKKAAKARKEATQSNHTQQGDDDEPSTTATNATKSSKAKKARTPSSGAKKSPKELGTASLEVMEATETTEPAEPMTTKKARAARPSSGKTPKGNQEPSAATPDITEPKTTTKAKNTSTSSSKGRKTSGITMSARRRADRDQQTQASHGEDEFSSDTDAENAEDIPARVSSSQKI